MAMVMAAATTFVFLIFLFPYLQLTEAQIGVCYGMHGNKLPSGEDVVHLYQSNGIGAMRIYSPDQGTLQALQGKGIKLILDVGNGNIQLLGSNPSAAIQWVQTNVVPFVSSIKYIAVGNEVQLSSNIAPSVGPAMQNILNALISVKLGDQIKVSTAIDLSQFMNTNPPSNGMFRDMSFMGPILDILKSNRSPLLVNLYTYFSYLHDKKNIDISYALLNSSGTFFTDEQSGLPYKNLFEATVDSVYAALAKAGAPNTAIVVSESGWPSDGGDSATVDNAGAYYRNLINRVKQNQGTPLKPGQGIETYLFAMFDEDRKTGDPTEQHYGLFNPTTQQQKYQLKFN